MRRASVYRRVESVTTFREAPPPRPLRATAVAVGGVVVAIGGFVAVLYFAGMIGAPMPAVPIDVEVVARRATMLGKDISRPIGAAEVEQLRRRGEVVAVVPRIAMQVPALGTANFGGQEVRFEVGGFTDGIPAAAVAGDPALVGRFVDLDPAAAPGPVCDAEAGDDTCPDPAAAYCDARAGRCRPRVPVIVSPTMIELYDQQYARDQGLAPLGEVELLVATRDRRLAFTISLGESMVTTDRDAPVAPRRIGALVVGVSPRARPIGMTVPIGYVAAWHRERLDERAATNYSSLTVTLRAAARLAAFTAWVREHLELEVEPPVAPPAAP